MRTACPARPAGGKREGHQDDQRRAAGTGRREHRGRGRAAGLRHLGGEPGNTHQVAQAIAPASRVVYVDYDPVVLTHARALLTSNHEGATDYIEADLRDTGVILSRASQLLDFTRPVAVTLIAILNAIPDSDDPQGIVARLMDAVPPGSYLALTHLASDLLGQETQEGLEDMQDQMMRMRFTSRDREQVAASSPGPSWSSPVSCQSGNGARTP